MIALSVMALSCQSAFSAMLNFQEFYKIILNYELEGVGTSFATKGFVFNYTPAPGEPYPVGFQLVGKSWLYNDGSTAFQSDSANSTITLTAADNSPFSVYTIDLAETNGAAGYPAAIVNFEGTTVSGQKVYQVMHLDGVNGFENFKFSDQFRNLTSLSWQQGDNVTNGVHMLDNLFVMPAK